MPSIVIPVEELCGAVITGFYGIRFRLSVVTVKGDAVLVGAQTLQSVRSGGKAAHAAFCPWKDEEDWRKLSAVRAVDHPGLVIARSCIQDRWCGMARRLCRAGRDEGARSVFFVVPRIMKDWA